MKLSLFTDRWEMKSPFITSKDEIHHIDTLTVCLGKDGVCGRGEALGVDYLGEDTQSMMAQLESIRTIVESGRGREEIQGLLPPGGARNALDCALWDLQAKLSGRRVHEMVGTSNLPVTTAYTLSMDSPQRMAREAERHQQFPVLKLKLNHERVAESVDRVHLAAPNSRLIIDANGSWSIPLLEEVADSLQANGVEMVEQPLPMGKDDALARLDYPLSLCADESCQSFSDLPRIAGLYGMVNIKLDKCGGLTEAVRMVHWCHENGLELMVGNMLGSSLAMAPGFVIAQFCRFVDLDGPLWQKTDRNSPIVYEGALMQAPLSSLWG